MLGTRIAWTCWALVPVAALAFHFGPGQNAYTLDRAAHLQKAAASFESQAAAVQEAAHERHIASIDARRAAFLSQSPEDTAKARAAATQEDTAYSAASEAWKKAADAFAQIETVLADTKSDSLSRVRWAKSRAMVRSGEIAQGANNLEDLLDEFTKAGKADTDLANATREELATAYYYGARLMRLAGKSAQEWRAVSSRSRQQFRYLAEQNQGKAGTKDRVTDYERNLELVLNLEQSSLNDLQGKPLPKNSPRNGAEGLGKGKGKSPRPPKKGDDRGAGGAGDIGDGW